MFLGGRASTWFTNKPNNIVRPSLYPDKITSVYHAVSTQTQKEKKKKLQTGKTKQKQNTFISLVPCLESLK